MKRKELIRLDDQPQREISTGRSVPESGRCSPLRRSVGKVIQGNWLKAEEHFRARRDGLRANKAQAEELDTENVPDWGYALLRLGKTQEAMNVLLSADLTASQKRFDDDSLYLWDSRAFMHSVSALPAIKKPRLRHWLSPFLNSLS